MNAKNSCPITGHTLVGLAVLQKESDDLRLIFNQQNKMAAEAAIASRDWAALRKAEVKKYGSSEEYKMYLYVFSSFIHFISIFQGIFKSQGLD